VSEAQGFGPFRFSALVEQVEGELAAALELRPLPLDPSLAEAVGEWKGAPVWIHTRAYRGPRLRYCRFVRLVGPPLEIGNLLCLADPLYPLPIFGADLVALGRETAMLAVDLTPTLPPGPRRDRQLGDLARGRSQAPSLPSGGELPAWCREWFSPYALYTRVHVHQLPDALQAFQLFPREFVALVAAAQPTPDLSAQVQAAQEGYLSAHRRDDKGLGLLARMFGASWAQRYLEEVLFPSVASGQTA
jgi:phycocyanobilin:ferredoxin oxidoreductase